MVVCSRFIVSMVNKLFTINSRDQRLQQNFTTETHFPIYPPTFGWNFFPSAPFSGCTEKLCNLMANSKRKKRQTEFFAAGLWQLRAINFLREKKIAINKFYAKSLIGNRMNFIYELRSILIFRFRVTFTVFQEFPIHASLIKWYGNESTYLCQRLEIYKIAK